MSPWWFALLGTLLMAGCANADARPSSTPAPAPAAAPPAEVRGTWITTTANSAISTPESTAETMRRLRAIGLNTVYVECWKNGYTQYPSEVLKRTIGVDRRPNLMPQDPSDTPEQLKRGPRDLLGEAITEAHRNGLLCIGWFEYGFMAAHKDTVNHLRKQKPEWLSRDIKGSEVAPNGFVWMNPLHPEARQFLIDIVVEAIDKYDLDGVQLDDRIVWPYYTMGYDDYTKAAYAKDHNGAQPPADPKDAEWTRWRVNKVNEYAIIFVDAVRKARPGILISLSPAPYPWCLENYLLEWPRWASWTTFTREMNPTQTRAATDQGWDEFIPQCYRYNWPAFKATWDQQIDSLKQFKADARIKDMLAGILITGSEPKPVPFGDLRKAAEHTRMTGGGGHVWWFSTGLLDVYTNEMTAFYDVASKGYAPHPKFPADWRTPSIALKRGEGRTWTAAAAPGSYQIVGQRQGVWSPLGSKIVAGGQAESIAFTAEADYDHVELLVDRRPQLSKGDRK